MLRGNNGDSPEIDTLIGKRTRLDGGVHFEGALHIDGQVDGAVICKGDGLVVISKEGRVNGRIDVSEVVIDGQVDGEVKAGKRLELRENARVKGEIEYGSIVMAMGARVDGQLGCSNNDSLGSKLPS